VIVCGIAPGATAGWVASDFAFWPDVVRASWVGNRLVRRPGPSKRCPTPCLRDIAWVDALAEPLEQWRPDLIVIEEACDAQRYWRASEKLAHFSFLGGNSNSLTQEEREVQKGTLFRSGAAYFAALLAAARQFRTRQAEIRSHPVTNYDGRRGWMQKDGGGISRRERVLQNAQFFARSILNAPRDRLSEHECMAVGLIVAQQSFSTSERMLARAD
jgi:hypothetical protein